QIIGAIPNLLCQAGVGQGGIHAVGIGFGGPVDEQARSAIKSHTISGWDDFPLVKWAEDTLGWPAVIGNDADVAGLAEAAIGAGRGLSPIFYITVGSGIGGGLIIDGKIYRGTGLGAAEIGHLRMLSPGGEFLPLEQLASGWGIAQQAVNRIGKGEDGAMMTK